MEYTAELTAPVIHAEAEPSKYVPPSRYESTRLSVLLWCLLGIVIGLVWGALTSIGKGLEEKIYIFSSKLFLATWALKDLPQIIFNTRRHATKGLSIDTYYLELMGFLSLVVFTGYDIQVIESVKTTKFSLDFDILQLLLGIVLSLGSGIIIIQMYVAHGYRRKIHRGVNSISSKSNFFISTFIFFNVLYLILIFVPSARGGATVSRNQYFTAFLYSCGLFLSIRWIPFIWTNMLDKQCVGISLSSVSLELIGAVSLLVMIVTEGYNKGDYETSGSSDLPASVLSTINRKLMLSVVGASSFFCCAVICNQSLRYRGNVLPPTADAGHPEVEAHTTIAHPTAAAHPAAHADRQNEPVWVDVEASNSSHTHNAVGRAHPTHLEHSPAPSTSSAPAGHVSPSAPQSAASPPLVSVDSHLTMAHSPNPLPTAPAPPARFQGPHESATSHWHPAEDSEKNVPFWEPPHPVSEAATSNPPAPTRKAPKYPKKNSQKTSSDSASEN